MSLGVTLLVGLAGAFGSLLRFAVGGVVTRRVRWSLPLGTLTVNLTGALLLGLLTGLATTTNASLIVGTGLLGGYTTFSTWMLETERLAEAQRARWAVANVVVSLLVGVAAIAVGRAISG